MLGVSFLMYFVLVIGMKFCTITCNGKIIAKNVKYCDSLFSRMKGLMFTRTAKDGIILVSSKEGILESSIHMFFVFYPIDVVWLDEKYKVVDKRKKVKPFSFHVKPKMPAKYVLELPVSNTSIKIGDKLSVSHLM